MYEFSRKDQRKIRYSLLITRKAGVATSFWSRCSTIKALFLVMLVILSYIIIDNWKAVSTIIEISQDVNTMAFKKAMSIKAYKALKQTEYKYKMLLETTDANEMKMLESIYQRNLTFSWGNRYGLLPPSKPVFYKDCLRYLQKEYYHRVSIVISFKDELLSILLRTLTTIVFRTPMHLLHEIILVDDGSFHDHKLGVISHIRWLEVPIVWYRRNNSVGIANARHFGIQRASGDVVAILDSHMVVSEMWLQPLLATLSEKPKGIIVPLVQMIGDHEYDKFHLHKINPYSWKMIRGYEGLGYTDVRINETNETQPYKTPVIGGGAFIADRTNLLEIWPHQFHPGLWGVENLRLSLRAWACAGGLWVNVCGKVTHPNGLDPNLSRYKVGNSQLRKFRLSETAAEIVNIMKKRKDADRLIRSTHFSQLREEIFETANVLSESFNYTKCQNDYDWYLKNVHGNYHFKIFDHSRFVQVGVFQSAAEPTRCIVNIPSKAEVQTDTDCISAIGDTDIADPHLMGISTSPRGVTISTDAYYSPSCWDAHHRSVKRKRTFGSTVLSSNNLQYLRISN